MLPFTPKRQMCLPCALKLKHDLGSWEVGDALGYVRVATLPSRSPGPALDPCQVLTLSLPAWICSFFHGGGVHGLPLLFRQAAVVPYRLDQGWAAFGSQRLFVSLTASLMPT